MSRYAQTVRWYVVRQDGAREEIAQPKLTVEPLGSTGGEARYLYDFDNGSVLLGNGDTLAYEIVQTAETK